MGNKLYLIRRGESLSDKRPNTMADRDFLTRLGEAQARLTALFFTTEGIELPIIVSSPALNARHTSSIIAEEQSITSEVKVLPNFSELIVWEEASKVEAAFRAQVLPLLSISNVLIVSHYYTMRALFLALAAPENTASCNGKAIGHCTTFVWDTEHPGRILTVDPNVHYSKD